MRTFSDYEAGRIIVINLERGEKFWKASSRN